MFTVHIYTSEIILQGSIKRPHTLCKWPVTVTKDMRTGNACTHVQACTLMFGDVINVIKTTLNED